MAARTSSLDDYRPFIFWGSVLGLGMVAVLASINAARDDDRRAVVLAAITGWPFLLGLLALYLNTSIAVKRWLLLIAAIGAAAIALPLVFSGIGFWFLGTAVTYGWVWRSSRSASP